MTIDRDPMIGDPIHYVDTTGKCRAATVTALGVPASIEGAGSGVSLVAFFPGPRAHVRFPEDVSYFSLKAAGLVAEPHTWHGLH